MQFTRESIFVSAIRSFFTSFFAILGILVGAVAVVMALVMLPPTNYVTEKTEFTIVPDAEGNRTLLPESTPAILRIDIHGVIGDHLLPAEMIENMLLDSRENFLKDNRVKGIFLHFNTPGGTVTDADAIYRALKTYKEKYKVPIYGYVEGLCASGGMYIAASADQMYASTSSVIGSIGVIMGPTFNFSQAMDKIGVQSLTMTEGKDKDALNPFRPWKPGEDDSLRAIIASFYQRFVDIVTTARPMIDKEKLIDEYGAHVFDATEAQKIGYIDVADSSYDEALQALVRAAGISENTSYQVVRLEPVRSFLSEFAEGRSPLVSGKIEHTFQVAPHLSSEMSGKFLYLYQP